MSIDQDEYNRLMGFDKDSNDPMSVVRDQAEYNRLMGFDKDSDGQLPMMTKINEDQKGIVQDDKNKNDLVKITNRESGKSYFITSQPLGSGGYGSVYKGITETGQTVAVKYYSPDVSYDNVMREYTIQHVLNEKKISGICQVLDSPIFAGVSVGSYAVIEFVQGNTLAHLIEATRTQTWIREEALKMSNTFLDFMRQLARIVQRLHQECVVHYDMKPLNIMIREEEQTLVLIDLGMGCFEQKCIPATDPEEFEVESKQFACFRRESTFGYVAPEIYKVSERNYDFRLFDVYALGKVFTDLITGTISYERGKRFETYIHQVKPDEAIKAYETGHRELNALIQQMVLEPYEKRPSIATIIETLDRIEISRPFPIFNINA